MEEARQSIEWRGIILLCLTGGRINLDQDKIVVGWREWLALPDLGIKAIKAKIDTGARTSSLHTFGLEPFEQDGKLKVKFGIHPLQRREDIAVRCIADVSDYRRVTSSDGQSEKRYIIVTNVALKGSIWQVEISLANRESMRFRMLLGRVAISGKLVVDPEKSYLCGRRLSKQYAKRPVRKAISRRKLPPAKPTH